MSPDARAVVIGGGIAGLAAAHRLAARLGPGEVVLVEKEPRLGGKILTERVAGYVIEGGPDCFLASKPAGLALCRDLGLAHGLIPANPRCRRSYLKRAGRLHEIPDGLSGLVPSRLGPLLTTQVLSLGGRLRAGLEYFVPAREGDGDESVAAFVTRRFGREAYRWLVEPLLGGIYAGDGGELSLRSTFPQLLELERRHGSVLRGMMHARRVVVGGATRPASPGFVTPRQGLGAIVERLQRNLPPGLARVGAGAVAVGVTPAGYRVELEDGSAIVSETVVAATPAFATADLVAALDPELAALLRGIRFASTATVSVAYAAEAAPHLPEGYGYVSPKAEGGPIVACTWTSNKFPERAPAGHALIRFFLGRASGAAHDLGDDDALRQVVRGELARVLGITAEPGLWRVYRWPSGMPQYTLGHLDRLQGIERRLARLPGLRVAGSSYRGAGLPDCIASGWAAADAVLGVRERAA